MFIKRKHALILSSIFLVIASGNIFAQTTSAETYYNRGIAYFKQGKYDLAIAEYTKAIELGPRRAAPYQSRGAAYFKQGKYDLAISDFTKSIQIYPKFANAYYSRGSIYWLKRKYNLAIADYSKAIQINPLYVNAYQGRVAAYFKQGKYDLAIASFTRAINLDPRFVMGHYWRGRTFVSKIPVAVPWKTDPNYLLAIASFTRAIELDPGFVPGHYWRGTTYIRGNEYDRAITDLRKVIELDAKHKDAQNSLARVLAYIRDLKKTSEERDRYTREKRLAEKRDVKKAPEKTDEATRHFNKGSAFYNQRRYDQAIAEYTKAIQINPQHAKAIHNRGEAYYLQRKYALAISDFTKAIQIDPKDSFSFNWRGRSYIIVKEYDRAIADLDAVLIFNRNDVAARNWLAVAYERKGDLKKALEVIDFTIAQTKAVTPQITRYRILTGLNRTAEADETLEKAVTIANRNELNSIGYVMLRAKRYKKAIEYFRLNITRHPKNVNGYDSLGEAYKIAGDFENAKIYLRKALSMNPPANVKANSEKLLKEIEDAQKR